MKLKLEQQIRPEQPEEQKESPAEFVGSKEPEKWDGCVEKNLLLEYFKNHRKLESEMEAKGADEETMKMLKETLRQSMERVIEFQKEAEISKLEKELKKQKREGR